MFEKLEIPLLNYSYNRIKHCVTGQFKGIEFSLQQQYLLTIENYYEFNLSENLIEKEILNACSRYPSRTPYLAKQMYAHKYHNVLQPFIENIDVFKILYIKYFTI